MIGRVNYSPATPTDNKFIKCYCQTFRFIGCYQDVKFQQIWQKVRLNNIINPIFKSSLFQAFWQADSQELV